MAGICETIINKRSFLRGDNLVTLKVSDLPRRFHERSQISTRQYGRLVRGWIFCTGLEPSGYDTHSMRRTKRAEIYRKTGNLCAVQLLLVHTKVDNAVRHLKAIAGLVHFSR